MHKERYMQLDATQVQRISELTQIMRLKFPCIKDDMVSTNKSIIDLIETGTQCKCFINI